MLNDGSNQKPPVYKMGELSFPLVLPGHAGQGKGRIWQAILELADNAQTSDRSGRKYTLISSHRVGLLTSTPVWSCG